jgi:hypothetical protein
MTALKLQLQAGGTNQQTAGGTNNVGLLNRVELKNL